MNKNICNECGTENEQDYKYCKNCGTPLFEKEEPKAPPKSDFQSNDYIKAQRFGNKYFLYDCVEEFDGVPREDVALFVGRKEYEILPKFCKMEVSDSKVSWCWPAAILGLLFGPVGSALWFFYRKMYKPAVILSIIGTVIIILSSLFTVNVDSAVYDNFFENFSNGDYSAAIETLEEYVESEDAETTGSIFVGFIESITGLGTAIYCGLYGYYIYKNHCVKKITAFKASLKDTRYYNLGLVSLGGVSGGMLFVGIVIFLTANEIPSVMALLYSLIK